MALPNACPGVWLWRIEPGGEAVPVPASTSGRILLVADGELTASSLTAKLDLVRVGPHSWLRARRSS